MRTAPEGVRFLLDALDPRHTFKEHSGGRAVIPMHRFVGLTVLAILTSISEAAAPNALAKRPVLPLVQYESGTDPRSVALADVNGDGILDLISADFDSDSVSVRRGDGLGYFRTRMNVGVGDGPAAMVVADVTGDGILDIVVAESAADTVSVLRGLGTGFFAPRQSFPCGDGPQALRVADADGDGDADLYTADFVGNTVSILFNSGGGVFGDRVAISVGAGPVALGVGDLDGDSDTDIVVASSGTKQITVLRCDGGGSFASQVIQSLSKFVDLTDVDGDGRLDIIAGGRSGVGVLWNQGGLQFAPTSAMYVDSAQFSFVSLADTNSDGRRDLVALNSEYDFTRQVPFGVYIRIRNADGTFGPIQRFDSGQTPVWGALGDINGDGSIDIATACSNDDAIGTLWNRGNGTFDNAILSTIWFDTLASMIPCDFDVDGVVDLLNGDLIFRGLGDGTFELHRVLQHSGQRVDSVPLHLDQDEYPDIAMCTVLPPTVQLFRYQPGSVTPVSTIALSREPGRIQVGDVNGDGLTDLLVCMSDIDAIASTLGVALALPGGGFGPMEEYPGLVAPSDIAVADLDGDSDMDIAVADGGGSLVEILLNAGGATFGDWIPFAANASPSAIRVADLDGDGAEDIVTASLQSNRITLLFNDGAAGFDQAQTYLTTRFSGSIATVDIDGDGDIDVVTGGDDVALHRNDGSGVLSMRTDHFAGDFDARIAVADFDGDGDPDVAAGTIDTAIYVLPGLWRHPRQPCPADIDGSLDVSLGDFTILASQFGETVEPGTGGDITGDGVVNSADFAVLAAAFGTECP